MTRRAYISLSLVGVVVVVAGLWLYRTYRWRMATSTVSRSATPIPAPQSPRGGPTPYPERFEMPGLVSERDGSVRVFLALDNEIPLKKKEGRQVVNTADPQAEQVLARVPILVVLDNDSYAKLDAAHDLLLSGEDLFTLKVSRETPDGDQIVFNYRQPSANVTGWEAAERKSFVVSWPTSNLTAGQYVVSVELAFGKHQTIRIHTKLT